MLHTRCQVVLTRLKLQSNRYVSSLSPLGTAFNSKPQKTSFIPNQIRDVWKSKEQKQKDIGLFQIPGLTRPEAFQELEEECERRCHSLVEEACTSEADGRRRLVSRVFDELSDELCQVADMAEFIRLAHPNNEIAQAAEKVCLSVSGLVEKLNTNVKLFDSLRNSVEKPSPNLPQEDVDVHVAKLFMLDFYQCGIHLPDAERERVVYLNDLILQFGQQFAAGCHQARVVNKINLPSHIRHHFNIDGDNVILNGLPIDNPNEVAREAGYKIYYWEDTNQENLLAEMIKLRHDLATLCEYDTYAHRAMSESLGESPVKVQAFLDRLSQELKPRVSRNYAEMANLNQKYFGTNSLDVWDVPYFTGFVRQNYFHQIDHLRIQEFFSLGACMEGLDRLFYHLYNVRLRLKDPLPGELWHNDVYKLSVEDMDSGEELGLIYCDFYARSGKPFQDCHFTIKGGRLCDQDRSYQNPVVVLMLNFPSARWGSPTLLTSNMMDNLFHEMGHAMHSMLGRTKYQHVTGTRCSTDFAEVPSTLMEYFSSDPRVLRDVSCHFRTGEKLKIDVLEKYVASRKIYSECDIQNQLCYALLDQKLHGLHPLNKSTTEVMQQIHSENHNLPFPTGTAWQHRFSHLVGYGARYYSYLLARSVASNIWQKFFQENPYDSEKGAEFRENCLAWGGGKPSPNIIGDILGHDVNPVQLADALITEIEEKQDMIRKLSP